MIAASKGRRYSIDPDLLNVPFTLLSCIVYPNVSLVKDAKYYNALEMEMVPLSHY